MIRFLPNVFLRHVGDESVVWCPRSGGCTIMRNSRQVLEEISSRWCKIDDIIRAVASKSDCDEDGVREGVSAIVDELACQRFIEIMGRESLTGRACDCGTCDAFASDSFINDDWSLLRRLYAQSNLPIELHVDLTDACNEKCIHCYLPRGRTHYLDKDIAIKVLKEFREAQGLTVYISGGECMLHKDFAEILHYAKRLGLNVVVMSNLTLCNEEIVALLKEIDPQFVNVSLYAVNEDIHDSITQAPGSCRKTKAAIDSLQESGVHIRIATPFMHANRGCLTELKEYSDRHCVRLIADCEIFGQLDHSCVNQRHALTMKELQYVVSRDIDAFWQARIEAERCQSDAKVCDIGETRFNISAEAMYYPCDGFHGAIIGDARKDSLLDVWTGDALNKLRALKNKDFGPCASCNDRAWCKVCPMRNFNETGDMFTHAPWRCDAARLYHRIFEEK